MWAEPGEGAAGSPARREDSRAIPRPVEAGPSSKARRALFSPEHDLFRDQVRRFFEREIAPHHAAWEKAGIVSRDAWLAMGRAGYLCTNVPEAYGGAGADRLYAAILIEEQQRLGLTGPGFYLHSDIIASYLVRYGSEAQKRSWLPRMATGEAIAAIAMTEPGAGSDLKAMRTAARRTADGYRVDGQKTFISNGASADLVVLCAKTDHAAGAKGISLFLVDAATPGFHRGRRLEKVGCHAADTSELFFEDMLVPESCLLGQEGQGFGMLMHELPWERLIIAIDAVATAEAAIAWTLDHVRERKAFGKPLLDFQNTRFRLAECRTETTVARVFVDHCLERANRDDLDPETAAMAKYWTTELQDRVIDQCVQLHGGYGYMAEYPIARAWVDSRYQRIAGGSNEIMREVIGRGL